FTDVARTGTRLADCALDIHLRRELGLQVVATVFECAGDGAQAGYCRSDQLALGLEAVQEQREHAAQARIQVGFGLASPHLPVVENRAAAQVGTDQVAVEELVEGRAGSLRELLKAFEPGGRAAATVGEGGLRQIVEAIVEAVDAELRRQDGRILQRLVEEGLRELGELRHTAGATCAVLRRQPPAKYAAHHYQGRPQRWTTLRNPVDAVEGQLSTQSTESLFHRQRIAGPNHLDR